MRKKTGFLFSLLALIIYSTGALASNQESLSLSDADCIKCHDKQPATIAASGNKHKTEVGCLDCHTEHPPEGKSAIPNCSVCHSDSPHYKLENCGSCHSDTHAPLDLNIEGEVSAPCLTC
ncbi:MAG: cytochrome C, partial [Proteobacteria bacterium]|nr:cytochrome C [Pseudomonadota bacterium]